MPHHLIDVADARRAVQRRPLRGRARRAAIATIHARGRARVLAGGTGLYIRALLEGLLGGARPATRDPRARSRREHAGAERGRGRRAPPPPPRARSTPRRRARIHPHDRARTCARSRSRRATGGRPPSCAARTASATRRYARAPPRARPGPRGARRAHRPRAASAMIEAGLLQEVRAAARARLRPGAARDAGDRVPPHAAGDRRAPTRSRTCSSSMQRDTRQFARRQRTWLRGVPDAVWVDPDDVAAIEARVRGVPRRRAAVRAAEALAQLAARRRVVDAELHVVDPVLPVDQARGVLGAGRRAGRCRPRRGAAPCPARTPCMPVTPRSTPAPALHHGVPGEARERVEDADRRGVADVRACSGRSSPAETTGDAAMSSGACVRFWIERLSVCGDAPAGAAARASRQPASQGHGRGIRSHGRILLGSLRPRSQRAARAPENGVSGHPGAA